MVVQAEEDLDGWADRLVNQLSNRGPIGISSVLWDRNDFARALRESACAQMAGFFARGAAPIHFENIQHRESLDRAGFRERKNEILSLIAQRRCSEAASLTEAWFKDISFPSAKDMKWAVDYCRRMVLSIEELYYQEVNKSVQELTVPGSVTECAERCSQLLDGINRSYHHRCSPSISAALDYIHRHYAENISMAEAARQVFRSPEYFSRQFKEEVGENFNAYLTLYRLDRAQELLDQTDLRIAEIAERVGYTTPGYFSKLYKKYKGITPEQARVAKK